MRCIGNDPGAPKYKICWEKWVLTEFEEMEYQKHSCADKTYTSALPVQSGFLHSRNREWDKYLHILMIIAVRKYLILCISSTSTVNASIHDIAAGCSWRMQIRPPENFWSHRPARKLLPTKIKCSLPRELSNFIHPRLVASQKFPAFLNPQSVYLNPAS